MKIEIIPCLNDNYSYLIHDQISNTVAIVDPSEFIPCDTIISKNYKKLDFILNTHHHYDLSLIHISEPTRRTPISYAVFCLKKD